MGPLFIAQVVALGDLRYATRFFIVGQAEKIINKSPFLLCLYNAFML
jgi:hypothetical protein